MPYHTLLAGEKSWLKPLLFAVTMSCLLLLYKGYVFPDGNHGQDLPPVMAILDPRLFTNDFAVQSFLGPTPRYFYQRLIADLSIISDAPIDKVVFFLNAISNLSFFSAIYFLARNLSIGLRLETLAGDRIYVLATALSLLTMLPLHSWGSPIYYSGGFASTFAIAIAIWSLVFALQERWMTAFFMAGLATLLQFLVGFYAGLVLFPALLHHAWRRSNFVFGVSATVIWLAPAVTIYAAMQTARPDLPPTFNFLEVFGRYRVPHHWLPSTGSVSAWAADALLFIAGLAAARYLHLVRREQAAVTFLLATALLVSAFGVLLNVVFVEVWPITFIGKLQFQRIMPFGHLVAFALLLSFVVVVIESSGRRRPQRWVMLVASLGALPAIGYTVFDHAAPNLILFLLILIIGVVFALGDRILKQLPEVALAIAFLTAVVVLFSDVRSVLPNRIAAVAGDRYRPFLPKTFPGDKIASWLRENTAVDEVILYPPDWTAFLDTLQLHSMRSAYFVHKNVPYSDFGVYQWSIRAEELLGTPVSRMIDNDERRRLWRERTSSEIIEIARRHGICFVVDRFADHPNLTSEAIVKEEISGEVWAVWRLSGC